jgi:ABC-type long-subunit fatty acid transport system fused permease/ATPase subunit
MNRTLETLGVVLLSSLFGFILFLPLYLAITETTEEPPQKFEVVDTYKNCVVIRYTPHNSAHYHYFLDCPRDT